MVSEKYLKNKANIERYNQTENGRAKVREAIARYMQKEDAKIKMKEYKNSEEYKKYHREYMRKYMRERRAKQALLND